MYVQVFQERVIQVCILVENLIYKWGGCDDKGLPRTSTKQYEFHASCSVMIMVKL